MNQTILANAVEEAEQALAAQEAEAQRDPTDAEIADSNARLLADVASALQVAPEPGLNKAGDVVHKGDAAMPMAAVIQSIESAGYLYIWDTLTGERSITNRNMLPTQLQKRREDGSRVFSTQPVKSKVAPGKHRCRLHKDDPEWPLFEAMGFRSCKKATLVSPMEVRNHMEHRHKTAWKTIESMRIDREKQEDRQLQRTLIEAVTKQTKPQRAARGGFRAPGRDAETEEQRQARQAALDAERNAASAGNED
jgi:hypothetical protein